MVWRWDLHGSLFSGLYRRPGSKIMLRELGRPGHQIVPCRSHKETEKSMYRHIKTPDYLLELESMH